MDNLLLIAAIAGETDGFCAQTANIWQIVGYALLIFKIVVPIILIGLGALDLGKAVIGSKDDDVKKAVGALVRRAIAAVAIFLLPTIIGLVMQFVGGWSDSGAEADYLVCKSCITKPSSGSTCDDYAKSAWGTD